MLLRTSLDRPGGAQTSSKDTSEDSSVGDALEEKIVCKDNAMPPILLPTIRNASSRPLIDFRNSAPRNELLKILLLMMTAEQ